MTHPDLPYSGELYRKALHLLALVLPAGVVVLGKPLALWILLPLALTALALDVLRVRWVWLNRTIDTGFGWMMRRAERPRVGAPVRVNGASWVLTSMALLTLLFPVDVAVVSFVVFMLGDAAAALVGRGMGRLHWGGSGRTVEGTVAFLVVGMGSAVALAAPFVPFAPFAFPLWMLAVAVMTAAVLETLPLPVNDNLAAPLGAAGVLYGLLLFF